MEEDEASSTTSIRDGRLHSLWLYPSVGMTAEVKMETQFGFGAGFYSKR